MSLSLTRQELSRLPKRLLHRGRLFNATLWQVSRDGEWVVKDVSLTPWLYRWTLGRMAIGHEYQVVRHLQGLDGVPREPFRIDALAWGYRFVAGDILHLQDGTRCRADFFNDLERLARSFHECGIAHLDLRNARNVLVDPQNRPIVIDFQAAAFTRRMPGWMRRLLERIDLSGVYKHWLIRDSGTLGPERERILYWQLRMRHLWPLRGYRLPGRRRLYNEEVRFLERCRQNRKQRRSRVATPGPSGPGEPS